MELSCHRGDRQKTDQKNVLHRIKMFIIEGIMEEILELVHDSCKSDARKISSQERI